MRRAKIVVTIGPATESEERLRQLMLSGMDVARINMSHGERENHGKVIDRIRAISDELKKPVAVMLDLSGPKIRTGKLRGGQEVPLPEGALLRLTSEKIEGDAGRVFANYPLLAREVNSGDRILISDGEIELQVLETTGSDVITRVIHGGTLGEHKGINLPGAQISIPSITEKDIADLKFGIGHDIDLVAQSFVRSAADCARARDLINEFGGNARLIAKIEKPEAVEDFDNILKASDGVMVARGDLAVETSTERVPVIQKEIISKALLEGKTVITATQMLQSMIENPRPTRAEASDVSNAVLDGSDAVMLSGETAVGRFPVESVLMMDRIIRATEAMTSPAQAAMRNTLFGRHTGSYGRAVAEAAVLAAEEINCRLIVVITQSGHMARRIAALRPTQRIIALTPVTKSYRQLASLWGVEPYPLEQCSPSSDDLLQCGDRALLEYKLAERGEGIVVMAGKMPDITISLSMKLHRVGELAG
ncbi:MAG TPA: pyruvate kinase [Blastocatellia bacterium]|nr:pyruvate kinase [Blastocatellia bacterium]